jgi:uncharacterized protein (TIGR03437 family)
MRILSSVVFFGVSFSWAQSATSRSAIVGAGFANPFPIAVAPGQLLTLFVQPGAEYDPSAPLPSVTAVFWNGSDETMPVLQIQKATTGCTIPASAGCPNLLAVTVQVPFDAPTSPATANILLRPSGVGVSVNGVKTPYIGAQSLEDQVHFLTECDVILGGVNTNPTSRGLACTPMITHADGTAVSAIRPAVVGEELVAYVTGLGQTNPPLTTGQPAAASSPAVAAFSLDFNYRANALATQPGAVGAPVSNPLFAGATKGYIGLYQINFIVPPPPTGLQPCVNNTVSPDLNVVNQVFSNLTVSAGSTSSFDGAGICVQPQPVLDPPAVR